MIRWLVLFLAALTGMNAAADDLVRACAACHGAAGTPRLAGQRAAYLIDQMLNFQLLSRRDPTDSAHAKFPASSDQKRGRAINHLRDARQKGPGSKPGPLLFVDASFL